MLRKLGLLIVASICCFSTAVWAVGLGKSELHSGLNQPLKADIQLLSVKDLAEHELKISLATNEEFERVGVDKLFFLNSIKFKTLRDSNGNMYVQLTSHDPIKEPFLNFVIALNYPKGRFVKEFTFLLDPPVFEKNTASTLQKAKTNSSQTNPPKKNNQIQPEQSRQIDLTGDEYQVNQNDTLWKIAKNARPDNGATIHQTLVAIYQNNPHAFSNGNINSLLSGKTLTIPNAETIANVPHRAALQDVVTQTNQWKSGGARRIVDGNTQTTRETKGSAQPRLSLSTQDDKSSSQPNNISKIQSELARTQEQSAILQAENEELRNRLADLLEKVESNQSGSVIDVADNELAALTDSLANPDNDQATDDAQSQDNLNDNSDNNSVDTNADQLALDDSTTADADTNIVSQNETTEDAAQTKVEKPVVKKSPPRVVIPEPKKSFFDEIMDSGYMLAGIIVLIVMIAMAVFWRMRKRMEEDDFQDDLVASAGAGNSQVTETFELPDVGDDMLVELDMDDEQSENAGSDSDDESFDPIGEADIYIAYGKFEQAESLLNEAIDDNPIRSDLKVKLMECYAATDDKEKFDHLAAEVEEAIDAEEWNDKISEMKAAAWSGEVEANDEFDLPSTEDIFGDESDDFDPTIESANLNDKEDSSGFNLDADDSSDELEDFSLDDSDEEFDLDMDELDLDSEDLDSVDLDSEDLDSTDLDDSELDKPLITDNDDTALDLSSSDAVTETFDALDDEDFALDTDSLAVGDVDESFELDDEGTLDLDDESFDFDDEDSLLSDEDGESTEDEISTKLDLARAYIDMGDSEGAKEILSEVLTDGSDSQKAEAQALIDKAD
jgi:pilus assembly protein FimV